MTRKSLLAVTALVAVLAVTIVATRDGGAPAPDTSAERSNRARVTDTRDLPPLPRNKVLDRLAFDPEDPPRHDAPLRDQPPPPDPDQLPRPPAFGEPIQP
jgi:hypothetical protein